MNTTSHAIVQKVWSYCNVLRDAGVGYGDYLEQLTFFIFLKMAEEKRESGDSSIIPAAYSWEKLKEKRGADLATYYAELLTNLGKEQGMLGAIFEKAQNRINEPAMLAKLIDLIDKENWTLLGADIKGDIYEGLLQKNAEDVKSGAGQYFTPRALIHAIVECVRPQPLRSIGDPACGTGGFFLAAYDYLKDQVKTREEKQFLKLSTFGGNEIVPSTRRLCLMNLFLHNIGEMESEEVMISHDDALIADNGKRYDYVLTNPPFGKKSSISSVNEETGKMEKEELSYNRQDFLGVETSNKQLNFLLHIRTMLKIGGTAAVVLPDNILFEGGAGETVRKKLMETCELHTILRLPTGIFYAQGVKANVLFFEGKATAKTAHTKEVWIYDYRTNVHHTLKKNQLSFESLQDFITCYQPENRHKRQETWSEANPQGRWRKFSYEEIIARDKTNLDIFWLKDESLTDLDSLPDPDVLALEIIENIESALVGLRELTLG